jgi:hypothetical protein
MIGSLDFVLPRLGAMGHVRQGAMPHGSSCSLKVCGVFLRSIPVVKKYNGSLSPTRVEAYPPDTCFLLP